MTPRQQQDVRELLAKYDATNNLPTPPTPAEESMQNVCGMRAIAMLRTYLREAENPEPDPRAGRRIAPVEVYTILNTALKERRLEDRLSVLSRQIAELSRIEPRALDPEGFAQFILKDDATVLDALKVFEDFDDFSTDPSRWSMDKLVLERRNGMPAVLDEWDRRTGAD